MIELPSHPIYKRLKAILDHKVLASFLMSKFKAPRKLLRQSEYKWDSILAPFYLFRAFEPVGCCLLIKEYKSVILWFVGCLHSTAVVLGCTHRSVLFRNVHATIVVF